MRHYDDFDSVLDDRIWLREFADRRGLCGVQSPDDGEVLA